MRRLAACLAACLAVMETLSRRLISTHVSLHRNMNEMWDDEETEIRRQEFINRMYKFPQNPNFQLNNGAKMPVLGLGTWKDQQVSNTVQRSLRRGFR